MFINHFPKHLIVTPNEQTKQGWKSLYRDLPVEQKTGHAVYFTPNGFDKLSREESDVTQFNSVYIDVDCTKGDDVEAFVKQKTGEVFGTIEPSFIVRTKNGAHFHFLLKEPVMVTDESKRNYIYIMDNLVSYFNADLGAKGINRVLRVPGFKHYKDLNNPFDVSLTYESPDTKYTLEEIAKAIGVTYPAPIVEDKQVNFGSFTDNVADRLQKMLQKDNVAKLYNGDASAYDDDLSRADSALCCHLAFWFNKDPEAIEQVWLSSPLGNRKKTQDRQDYRKQTIDRAVALTDEVYTPKIDSRLSEDCVNCPEREEYLNHLAEADFEDEGWVKKLKKLETAYFNNFYKYFAITYPHLLFERGEDKSYFIYVDNEGIYKAVNYTDVRGLVIQLLIDEGMEGRATETSAKNVLHKYRGVFSSRAVTLDSFSVPDNLFPMKNGWFNLETEQLLSHSPEMLTLYKSPIEYDKNAKCPIWDKFLDEDLQMPKDQVRVIDQFGGYLLTPDISYHKSLFFDGRPGAGKSTIPIIWQKILGDLATQASLTSLEGSEVRFIGDVFAHRHFCFFDEANPRTRHINEFFQNLISGETIKVERKGIQEKPLVRNTLKLVVALNEMPDHMPPGMKRRYTHIKFTRSFVEEGIADPDLPKKVIENELPGVFNRMVRGLKDLQKMRGFTVIEGEEERRREYDLTSDDFSAFLNDNFDPVSDNDKSVRYNGQQLLLSFQNEYPRGYNKQLTVRGFNKKLLSTRLPEFQNISFVMGSDGKGYQGLKLKKDKYIQQKDSQYGDEKTYVIIQSVEGLEKYF